MIGSAIREMAAARTVPLISAAFYEGHAQIWNLDSHRMQEEFPVRKNGLKNLAMHPDGESIVTGFSARRGSVTAYRVANGEMMWHRDKIEEGGFLHFDWSGFHVSFTCSHGEKLETADARSGRTVELLANTGECIYGPNDYVFTVPSSGGNYLLSQHGHIVSVPKLTFALLDAAFSPAAICITESGGPVRCVDCRTGTEIWRYTPSEGSHALRLHFDCVEHVFYGVVWHYDRGRFRHLVRFDAETGRASVVCTLDSWEEVFSDAMRQLVTSSGEIIGLSSGKVVGELAFPLKEYPDPKLS